MNSCLLAVVVRRSHCKHQRRNCAGPELELTFSFRGRSHRVSSEKISGGCRLGRARGPPTGRRVSTPRASGGTAIRRVLDQPIFDVSFYRVMAPHPRAHVDPAKGYGSSQQLMSNALFVSPDHSRQAFLHRGRVTGGSVWHHSADSVRSTDGQLDLNPAWTMDLIGGDFGHPSFFPHDGKLLLMGTHPTTDSFSYISSPDGQASINAAMTALGGGPHQLETVAARPPGGAAPGRGVLHPVESPRVLRCPSRQLLQPSRHLARRNRHHRRRRCRRPNGHPSVEIQRRTHALEARWP